MMFPVLPPPALQALPPTSDAVLTDPEWVRRPTRAEIQAALPPAAREDGVGGQASFGCEIKADTTVTKCYPGDPEGGYGFNVAAAALSPTFRIRPATSNGKPIVAGRVVIPIRFEPPPGAPLKARAVWTQAPTAADVSAVLPTSHGRPHAGGVGVMRCTAAAGGGLLDCRPATSSDDPLGRAAVKLAGQFSIADYFTNGRSTQGVIFDIPVIFQSAGAKAAPPVLDDPPAWLRKPSPEQIAATVPTVARERGVAHMEADEACVVQTDGGLGSCRLTREAPVGVGVAEAAARLVNVYQTLVWLPEGRPTAGAAVKVTLKWDAPPAPPSQAPTKPADKRRR